jgi:SAM-dependent methyltransferase
MKRADWDRLADEFESETCDTTREESADLTGRFAALVPLPKRAVLADLGCGVGTFIHRFGARFARIHGVEFAPRIIARARTRCAALPVEWHTIDVARAADAIGRIAHLTVCMNVITQPTPAKRAALWASVAGVTRRGGHALVVVPSMESERMVVSAGGKKKWRTGGLVNRDGVWQKHYEREELTAIFAANGFVAPRIARAHYPWSVEGMRETGKRRANRPWDWITLARRA